MVCITYEYDYRLCDLIEYEFKELTATLRSPMIHKNEGKQITTLQIVYSVETIESCPNTLFL